MSILLLQGPGTDSSRLDGRTAAALWRRAQRCGHCLSCQACPSLDELVDSLRGRACAASDFVLLDPGDLHLAPARTLRCLHDALDDLAVPYVEVHGSSGQLLDLDLRTSRQPLATIAIAGDLGSSCMIAMGVAIRHLSLRGKRAARTVAAV